jgi:YHS domain-containing protein
MTRVLLFILLLLFLGRAILRLLSGIVEGASGEAGTGRSLERGVRMARDPVCGTFVVPSRALTAGNGNGVAYFCSEKCRAAYLAQAGANAAPRA